MQQVCTIDMLLETTVALLTKPCMASDFVNKLAEFGERCFYWIPKKLRPKLDLRWRIGTFVGNSQSSNEAFVAVGNGDVIKTRSVVRVMAPMRWSTENIMNIKGTPLIPRPQNPD